MGTKHNDIAGWQNILGDVSKVTGRYPGRVDVYTEREGTGWPTVRSALRCQNPRSTTELVTARDVVSATA